MSSNKNPEEYGLEEFIAALRSISFSETEPGRVAEQVRPLAERLALSPDLKARVKKEPDHDQGFGFQLLYEEPDHSLVVALLCWLPGRCTPPHDHGTWGVVVGVEGEEVNTFWERTDDGSQPEYADLQKTGEKKFSVGESLVLMPSTIHSIRNVSEEISVSLHVYGHHINYTKRSQFDPEQHSVQPWKIKELE